MKRNKFSLSHYKLLTGDMGYLLPIAWYEALPGDTIQQASSALVRCAPMNAPIMHPCLIRIHHWYVPLRLIWEDFEDFITGGDDGTFTATPPYQSAASISIGSLHDYLGVPDGSYSPNLEYSALPIRAYKMIYNEYYRDQDLNNERTISLASGADTTTDDYLERVCWEKDYFTSARPWEQKGDEVTISLGDTAPITGLGLDNASAAASAGLSMRETDGAAPRTVTGWNIYQGSPLHRAIMEEDSANTGYPDIRADLSAASGIPINDLRRALAIQRYQEARAMYGSRYVEYLRYLGVRSSDARLSRPEYLGGGRQILQFSEVLQTGLGASPVGSMFGHGIGAMRTNRFRRFFEEHGIVMTLMSVVPKSMYMQALHKKFHRQTKEDYFQKELQFIGDQAVLNKEVYASHASPDDVFGYQGRYDNYRSHPSGISGIFRSTLDYWHLARDFASPPALNNNFVNCSPSKRVFAATSEPGLYIMANNSIQARRMMASHPKPKTF